MVVDQSLTCYIRDNNTGSLVSFNIEKPEGYTDTYSPNFQQQDVRGRSSPFQSYTSSGPRMVSFTILLSLDYRRPLAEHTKAVMSMMKPYDRGMGMSVLPPSLHVKIGNALEIDAIPKSFSATWSKGYKEGVYRICEWSFSFTEVEQQGTYDEGIEDIESIVPSGMNYITSNVSTKITYDIGDTVDITSNTKVYETSNDATNRQNGSTIEEGTYTVKNVKGNTAEITSEEEGDLGWIVI